MSKKQIKLKPLKQGLKIQKFWPKFSVFYRPKISIRIFLLLTRNLPKYFENIEKKNNENTKTYASIGLKRTETYKKSKISKKNPKVSVKTSQKWLCPVVNLLLKATLPSCSVNVQVCSTGHGSTYCQNALHDGTWHGLPRACEMMWP